MIIEGKTYSELGKSLMKELIEPTGKIDNSGYGYFDALIVKKGYNTYRVIFRNKHEEKRIS